MKEILEKIKVGLNPQKGFTQTNKNRDVKNRVRGQMMHLNPPMIKKTSKEIKNGKTEASKNMGMKNNGFIHPFVRKRLSLGSPPMDLLPGLKKVFLYKTEQLGIGALTRLPPMDLRSISGSVAHLLLHSKLLRRHGNVETRILSCFTLGGASSG